MRSVLFLPWLAACGFQVGATQVDATAATCQVTAGTAALAGTVGLSTGGGTRGKLACPAGELIVGMAFEMSDGNANGQSPSAHGIRIACATLGIDANGPHQSMPMDHDVQGFGGAGFTPATWSPSTLCGPGSVVSKLAAHGGRRAQDTNLFMDTSIACTQVTAEGVTTPGPDLPIAEATHGTGMNPSSVTCAPGSQIVGFATDVGAGLDSVVVSCAPITCATSPGP